MLVEVRRQFTEKLVLSSYHVGPRMELRWQAYLQAPLHAEQSVSLALAVSNF